jgi:hypothetical protein
LGHLRVASTGISGGRQYWRATWSDAISKDVLLGEGETAGPADGYSGSIDFPFVAGPVPFGIAVTLYGYEGSTPPTPATTAEFSLTYVCDSLEVLSSRAGPYGTITPLATANYEGLWWTASFAYTLALDGAASGVTQTRQITRQVFRPPWTICH